MPRITHSEFIPRPSRKSPTAVGDSDEIRKTRVRHPSLDLAGSGSGRGIRSSEDVSAPDVSPSGFPNTEGNTPHTKFARLTCCDIEAGLFRRLGWAE